MRDRPTPDPGPTRRHGRDITEHGWLVQCSGGCLEVVHRDPPAIGDPCPICGPAQQRPANVAFVRPLIANISDSERIVLAEFVDDIDEEAGGPTMHGGGGDFDVVTGLTANSSSHLAGLISDPLGEVDSSFFANSSQDAEAHVFELGYDAIPLSEMPSSFSLSESSVPSATISYLSGPLSALVAFGFTISMLEQSIPIALIGWFCMTAGMAIPLAIRGVLLLLSSRAR